MNIKKLLNKTDVIYIDASTLMSPLHLYRFINRYEALFMACRKKITVPTMVYQELVRHTNSHNDKIAHTAMTGIELINQHPNLFSTEQALSDAKDSYRALSSSVLLKKLIISSYYKRQLLITNDREINQAVYKINKTHPSQAKDIFVYQVNNGGYLTTSILDECISSKQEPEDHFITPQIINPSSNNPEDDSEYIHKLIGISLMSFALGIGTGILSISIASTHKQL